MKPREVNRLLRELGYELARKNCHAIYRCPGQPILVVPNSGSDVRGHKNMLADLRRRHPGHPALARA